ncbi:MAG: DNA recombination protein RmuC [Amphiplicatus sp.]
MTAQESVGGGGAAREMDALTTGAPTAGALTAGALSEAAPAGPIVTGPAAMLWTGFAGAAFVFLVIFVLLMRSRLHGQTRRAETGSAAKSRKLQKGSRQTEFFQPAGAGAEITFDDQPAAGRANPSEAPEKPVEEAEAEIVIERVPAPAHPSPTMEEQASGQALAARRPGPFAVLFGGAKEAREATPSAAADETGEADAAPADEPAEIAESAIESEAGNRTREAAAMREAAIKEAVLKEAEWARAEAEAEEDRRRAEAERDLERERRRLAAFDEREEAIAARERALEEEAVLLEREADDFRRDVERELDDRFAALADRLEGRIKARAEAAPPDGAEAVANLARDIDRRFAALAEKLEAQPVVEAPHPPDTNVLAEIVARRVAKERSEINAAIDAVAARIDMLAGAPVDVKALRDEIGALKRALSERASGPTAPVVQLVDIVRNALPPAAYEMRAMLANNRRADCLIRLPHPPGPIAIDARFPSEAFDRLHAARDEDRARAENEFRRTALRHIVDIAERLIVPEETAESALMFVPSESMYTELHARFPDVVQDSYRARVWIVSPTTLMATLHTIRAVLRDAQARESAELIHSEAQHVLAEVDALRRRVVALEENFEKTRHDVRDVISSTDQVYRRAETISNTRRGLAEGALDRGSRRIPATPEEDEGPGRPHEPDEGPAPFPLR